MADFLYLKHPYTCLKENVVHRWKWKVNSNANDAGCNTGVIVGMYNPSSQCFKRMIEIGSDCDHVQAMNLRFNWIIIMELYNVRNIPGKALKGGPW
jgi:hypothetical protein